MANPQKQTVQRLPDVSSEGIVTNQAGFWMSGPRGPLLSAWGTRQREYELRNFYRSQYNAQIQGAFTGISKKIASTPWEIKGPDTDTLTKQAYATRLKATFGREAQTSDSDIEYYQTVLRLADFGRGWDSFIEKLAQDFLVQDAGAFIEIIAPGNPLKPPTGAVTGLAVLDPLRCIPTGSPDYPVVYYDAGGTAHVLHRSRVFQLVDAPSSDETHPGYGLSALSRAISIAWRQTKTAQYIEGRVDDKPPPGMISASGMMRGELDNALRLYTEQQRADEAPPWGRQLWFFSPDVQNASRIEPLSFSQAPENFNYEQYVNVDMNMLALALGVDIQELWQLSGGNIGSGAQSEILHQKSRGKTIGGLLTQLERLLNDILPDAYSFEFTARDEQEDRARADIAASWASTASLLRGVLSEAELKMLLINNVDAVRDAVGDTSGTVERADDADAHQSDEPLDEEIDDATETIETDTDGDSEQRNMGGTRHRGWDGELANTKTIQSTRIEFELDLADAIQGARDGQIERRRFGIIVRGLIARYGRRAYSFGLIDGGVTDGLLDADDESRVALLVAEQSSYITAFADTLYTTGISDTQAMTKPAMWFNKSITPFYDAGRLSADKNGNYVWIIGPTEEHCTDCVRLNGQVHRLRDWAKKNFIPPTDATECKGFNCKCRLMRSPARAQGRF